MVALVVIHEPRPFRDKRALTVGDCFDNVANQRLPVRGMIWPNILAKKFFKLLQGFIVVPKTILMHRRTITHSGAANRGGASLPREYQQCSSLQIYNIPRTGMWPLKVEY